MIHLRALSPDDWAAWRKLRLTALAEAPEAFSSTLADWQGLNDREERWRARLELPGSLNLIAADEEGDAGMASGLPGGGAGIVEVISMYVCARSRGRGVGVALLDALEAWAREGGATVLQLAVVLGNEHAIGLYRRHGFVQSGDRAVPLGDGLRAEIRMEKSLLDA